MYNIAERQSMSNEMSKPGVSGMAQIFRLEITGDFLLLLTLTWFFCGGEATAAFALAASACASSFMAKYSGSSAYSMGMITLFSSTGRAVPTP